MNYSEAATLRILCLLQSIKMPKKYPLWSLANNSTVPDNITIFWWLLNIYIDIYSPSFVWLQITMRRLCKTECTWRFFSILSAFFIRFWYLRCCGCPWNRGRQHLATPLKTCQNIEAGFLTGWMLCLSPNSDVTASARKLSFVIFNRNFASG